VSRATGFPMQVIETVLERAEGRCEVAMAGCTLLPVDMQHRRARGTGGTSRTNGNLPSGALAVCRSCHTWIEHNLAEAREYGWSVSLHEPDPDTIPALVWGVWVWLHDDGTTDPCSAATLRRMDLEDLHYDTGEHA